MSEAEIAQAVSRETADRLRLLVELLTKWQKTTNLIAPASLPAVWHRHIRDSLQLVALNEGLRWLDLGSGGGFPGLVVAAAIADRPGARVVLVESNQKKCAFLRLATREMGIPAEVRAERIESAVKQWAGPLDCISARALAPLPVLCGYVAPLIAKGAVALLHKGREAEREIAAARETWTIDLVKHASVTEDDAVILEIRALARL